MFPLIAGVGLAFLITEYAAVVTAQVEAVIVSATVAEPVPAAPHAIVADAVPCPELIVPPVTVQTYVLPVFAVVVYVAELFAQTDAEPLTTGVGFALIVTE